LTCKANELAVFDRAPVAERLRDPRVVAMRADWTRADPAITAYLQSFGRYGVPLDVVYGPGAPQGIPLPELLTPGAVLDAFTRASAGRKEEARE
jgi:suppressor for copper-sensitivity B